MGGLYINRIERKIMGEKNHNLSITKLFLDPYFGFKENGLS
jgi:hypothetical protein